MISFFQTLSWSPLFSSSLFEVRWGTRVVILSLAFLIMVDPALAAGLGEMLDNTKETAYTKLIPVLFIVGGSLGFIYKLWKGDMIGGLGILGVAVIAGFTLNSIYTGSFLTLLGGE